MEKKPRAKAHYTSPLWRAFEVRWTPKDPGDIRKKMVRAYLEKNPSPRFFADKVELDGNTLIMRVRATKKEGEVNLTERLIGNILTKLQRTIFGEKYSFINASTRVHREDCEIRIFNLYKISGSNLLYPIKMIGTSEDQVLEILNPRLNREIENREITFEELLANEEIGRIIDSCNKIPCWRATPKPVAQPKEEKPLGKYSKKRVKHEGQGDLF